MIHTSSLVELSSDLPVLIEVVEDRSHVDRLLPILDEMICGGALVTVEKVRILKYAAGGDRPVTDGRARPRRMNQSSWSQCGATPAPTWPTLR